MRVRYRTKSGSLYEVDEAGKRIRALVGGAASNGITSEWRGYYRLSMYGSRLRIYWGDSDNNDWTLTSPVLEVTYEEEV